MRTRHQGALVLLLPLAASCEHDTGRYQVVNPTPDRALNIMLVDTKTGHVWHYRDASPDSVPSARKVSVWCDPILYSDSIGHHQPLPPK
jgi:hypothetical protein